MKFLWSTLKSNYLLIAVLLISLFFRTYKVVERFEFAHDGDLFSWIVKDIVIDHHPRLIGQLTSAPGIFIGPLYYYSLIPFFLLTKMDPVGAIIPITIIGILTTFSYWFVFKKLWNEKAGLIAAFLHAILYTWVYFDRRIVPSTPTNLWTIWYFYCVVNLARGNFKVLWIVGLLVGLIWHIHIALLPALVAIPAAFFFSKKLPTKKDFLLFTFYFLLTSIPLILFEFRHNFSQTKSLFFNFSKEHGSSPGGLEKIQEVLTKISSNVEKLFFFPQSFPGNKFIFFAIILSIGLFLVYKKCLKLKEALLFYSWVLTIILFYGLSSSILSEYYFYNIEVILVGFVTLLFIWLFNQSKWLKYIVIATLSVIFINNAHYLTTSYYYAKGYNERKELTEFIVNDSKSKNYPCVAISYIASPGEDVGFRYFFWLNNLHVNKPSSGSPVYSIVQPEHLAYGKNEKHFGQIKLIPPPENEVKSSQEIQKSCAGENSNLTDSMFGFTK
ncbi:MAG: glycosyltransferase family 39 protein [Patescibacteria group bacterium]